MSDELFGPAPEGKVWICCACGKLSRTKSGIDGDSRPMAISGGWDESCMLNAALVDEDEARDARARAGMQAWPS